MLRLPLLPSTLPNPPAGVTSVFKSKYGTSVLGSLKGIPAVVQVINVATFLTREGFNLTCSKSKIENSTILYYWSSNTRSISQP